MSGVQPDVEKVLSTLSDWQVMTSIRRNQLKARDAWIGSTTARGVTMGVITSQKISDDGVVTERPLYSTYVYVDGVQTVIPRFDLYTNLWRRAGKIDPFNFYFWHNSLTMRNSKWFIDYYAEVMETLDEQVVLWGVDEPTRSTNLFKLIVEYIESLRCLILLMN
jgi:hypothetical protein